jgi:hypothetical protein
MAGSGRLDEAPQGAVPSGVPSGAGAQAGTASPPPAFPSPGPFCARLSPRGNDTERARPYVGLYHCAGLAASARRQGHLTFPPTDLPESRSAAADRGPPRLPRPLAQGRPRPWRGRYRLQAEAFEAWVWQTMRALDRLRASHGGSRTPSGRTVRRIRHSPSARRSTFSGTSSLGKAATRAVVDSHLTRIKGSGTYRSVQGLTSGPRLAKGGFCHDIERELPFRGRNSLHARM